MLAIRIKPFLRLFARPKPPAKPVALPTSAADTPHRWFHTSTRKKRPIRRAFNLLRNALEVLVGEPRGGWSARRKAERIARRKARFTQNWPA